MKDYLILITQDCIYKVIENTYIPEQGEFLVPRTNKYFYNDTGEISNNFYALKRGK